MTVSTKTLHIVGETKTFFFEPNTNLLKLLNANRLSINQACGANGTCTTCRVIVRSGLNTLGERSEIEVERADERQFASNERLACQTQLYDSITIEIPQFVT